MRPVKVAHVTTIDASLRYLLLNQMKSLRAAGYQVAGVSARGPEAPYIEAEGFKHFDVRLNRKLFSPIRDLAAFSDMWRLFRRERFTIVHTHTPKAGFLGQFAARAAGVPIVVNTLHGFYFHDQTPPLSRKAIIALERIAARWSDVILSQSSEDVGTALAEGIAAESKIRHLGNGIDLRRFDPALLRPELLKSKRAELGIPPEAPIVGYVGRLVEEKGVLDLFEAARVVVAQVPEVRFVFVGIVDQDRSGAVVPGREKEFQITHACHFLGRRHDMPELYALMNLLVLPSHREGFPRAPMEASAMQVPSVVTDIRGCREVVEQGVNGLLVPPRNPRALAEAILELLTHPERTRRMGEAGRKMASERFDERNVFASLEGEYARLLREKGLR